MYFLTCLSRFWSPPLHIMDLSETINYARTARDVPPTPSDDYGLIEDPIENQGRDPPTFSNYINSVSL